MNINTFDITISGDVRYGYYLPNGDYADFYFNGDYAFWKSYDNVQTLTLNLANIESFKKLSFPIVKITAKPKKINAFKKWWYSGCIEKLYDINIKLISIKDVTYIKMRSGKTYMIDESVECLKNAFEGCVWTADFLEHLTHN